MTSNWRQLCDMVIRGMPMANDEYSEGHYFAISGNMAVENGMNTEG